MKNRVVLAVLTALLLSMAACSLFEPPATPTGLTVSSSVNPSGGDEIVISWNAVSGASSYNLYDTKDGTTPTTSNYFKVYDITGASETLVNVSTATYYEFVVTAVNSYGESNPSSVETTTTP